MKSKTPLLIVLAIGVTLGVVVGTWFYAADKAEKILAVWAETRRAQGVDFQWKELAVTGFPLRIDVEFIDFSVRALFENGRVDWRPGQPVYGRMFAIEPRAVGYDLSGRHEIMVENPRTALNIRFDAREFTGMAYVSAAEQLRARKAVGHLQDIELVVDGQTAANGQPAPIRIGKADFNIERPENGAANPASINPGNIGFHSSVAAQRIGLPEGALSPQLNGILPDTIDSFSASVNVYGEMYPGAATPARLQAWRDAGGTAEVSGLEIKWGPVTITAEGTLALDPNLQPEGAFTAKVTGLDELIQALEKSGVVHSRDANIARLTLSVLTRPAPDGGPAVAEIPVSIQNGRVLAGPVPLLQLPVIEWQ